MNERRECLRVGRRREGEWETLKEVIHSLCVHLVRRRFITMDIS